MKATMDGILAKDRDLIHVCLRHDEEKGEENEF